ncbi:MAG: hypothetical protein R2731_02635 [Nocardioides sp.]
MDAGRAGRAQRPDRRPHPSSSATTWCVTWAQGNGAAREILDEGGLAALEDSSINIPAFGAVTVVLFVVFALLALVLASFLRWGHPWARYALTGVVAVMVFLGGGGDQPLGAGDVRRDLRAGAGGERRAAGLPVAPRHQRLPAPTLISRP